MEECVSQLHKLLLIKLAAIKKCSGTEYDRCFEDGADECLHIVKPYDQSELQDMNL